MSETRKSTGKRSKWIKRVLIAAIILAVAVTGYWIWTSYRNRIKAESLLQDTVTVVRGNIDRVVQAGGTVSYAEWITVDSPADGKVEDLLVQVGDAVQKDDVILTIRNDTLEEQILALEKDLEEADINLLSQSSMKMSSIRSLVSGRVKGIYINEGDDLAVVSGSTDGAILISLDDMMIVTIPANASVAPEDKVTIRIGDSETDGYVTASDKDGVVVAFPDNSFTIGDTATVTAAGGTVIGTGAIRVRAPYYVIATDGIVSSIPVKLDQTVSMGATLIKLEDPVYTSAYLSLLQSRQEIIEKLADKRAESELTELTAPENGVITELPYEEGAALVKDTPAAVISVSDRLELKVTVDEMDIASIYVGQTCRIFVYALEDHTFTGTVSWVAQAARDQDGISLYPATIRIDDPTDIRTGMSARTDIEIAKLTDVLLIPSEAIRIIDGKKYVMVADTFDAQGRTSETGRQVEIETGLTNGTETEIVSGLNAGDRVIMPAEEEEFNRFMF